VTVYLEATFGRDLLTISVRGDINRKMIEQNMQRSMFLADPSDKWNMDWAGYERADPSKSSANTGPNALRDS
jgi:hypothetical protein